MIDLEKINTNLITAIVAVAALGFSIFNFVIGRIDKKTRFRINLSQGTYNDKSNKSINNILIVEVVNSSQSLGTISHVSICQKKKPIITVENHLNDDQNSNLKYGENAIYWIERNELIEELQKSKKYGKIKLKARVQNTLGHRFFSNSITIELKKII